MWNTVIRKRWWEARYARYVKTVLGGIIPPDVQECVQEKVLLRDANGDPEMLFHLLGELAPARAIREEERAAIKKRQELRGTGGRRMGVGSGELGSLEATESACPPGGLAAGRYRSRISGLTRGGVTGKHVLLSDSVGTGSAGITAAVVHESK